MVVGVCDTGEGGGGEEQGSRGQEFVAEFLVSHTSTW